MSVIRDGFPQLVCVCSYGFPNWRGGVIHWATAPAERGGGGGYRYIRDRLRALSEQWGAAHPAVRAFFKPCDALERQANSAA